MTPQQFIAMVAPGATQAMKDHGLSTALLMAQGALESGWGKDAPGNNLFGIKADASWHGKSVTVPTREFYNGKWVTVQAAFRAYPSLSDSIADHVSFLLQNSRYANLQGADYQSACNLIHTDGYATDPHYPTLLLDIINQYQLNKYDEEVNQMAQATETKVVVNGQEYPAVVVNGDTYVRYDAFKEVPGYDGKFVQKEFHISFAAGK